MPADQTKSGCESFLLENGLPLKVGTISDDRAVQAPVLRGTDLYMFHESLRLPSTT
jgi:hypothetical protein